ncbi:MAG: hypothetical protein ABI832_01990 [bacterium]
MKNLFNTMRDNAAKRALYRKTRYEILGISTATAEDIGIYPSEAKAVARRAVWG